MRRIWRNAAFSALACLIASAALAQSDEDTATADDETEAVEVAIDPVAMEIAGNAARFLSGQKSMRFNWFVTYDDIVEGREKITFIRSGTNAMIRGEGFVANTERGDTIRDYYYDGKTFTVASPSEGFYSSEAFDGGFEALLAAARERLDMPLPLWSLMSETLGQNAVENVLGAAYLGTTLMRGQEVHHLAFTEYDEDWQIWISTDPERPVPLMIVGTDPYQQGWPQYRALLMDWSFDIDTPDGGFTYVPHELDVSVSMPALVPDAREKAISGSK